MQQGQPPERTSCVPVKGTGRSILKVLMDNLEDGVREMESVQNLVLSEETF